MKKTTINFFMKQKIDSVTREIEKKITQNTKTCTV